MLHDLVRECACPCCCGCVDRIIKKFEAAHEGQTDRCCLCISVPVSAHILGLLFTLVFFLSVRGYVFFLSGNGFSTSDSEDFSFYMFIAALSTAFPALTYLLMVKKNTKATRKLFVKAIKSFMAAISALFVVFTTLALILFLLIGIFGGQFVLIFLCIPIFLASWLVFKLTVHLSHVA